MGIAKPVKYLLVPIALLVAWIVGTFAFRYTIAPVDHYLIHHFNYVEGNALKLKNNYLTDLVEINLPWKYYITQFPRPACRTDPKKEPSLFEIKGVMLPDGVCYPLKSIRHWMLNDHFFELAKWIPFFPAYDLSYFFFMLFLVVASFFFFQEMFRFFLPRSADLGFYSSLAATLFSFSFPVGRELQYDGISQGIPFLLLAVASFQSTLRKKGKAGFLLGIVFMGFAYWKGSLQCLGIYTLFAVLFLSIWNWKRLRTEKGKVAVIAGSLLVGLLIGAFINRGAIHIFMSNVDGFLPVRNPSLLSQEMKRLGGLGFSLLNFFVGDMFFSHNTVDFSKSIGQIGAREVFSYDGNSYFIAPMVSLVFATLAWRLARVKTRKHLWNNDLSFLLGILALVLVADLVVIVLPTYRLLYYRFHQWWLAANLVLVFSILAAQGVPRKIAVKHYAIALGVFIAACLAGFVAIGSVQEKIVALMGNGGRMGFEPFFWKHRVSFWLERVTFRDAYSLTFLFMAVASLWALLKQKKFALISLVAIGGLGLNIFHYNEPQPQAPFFSFLKDFRWGVENKIVTENGRRWAENIMLFLNKPTGGMYDSLSTSEAVPLPEGGLYDKDWKARSPKIQGN